MKRRLLRLSAPGAAVVAVALVATSAGLTTGAGATPVFTPVVIKPSQGLNLGEPGIAAASDGSALYVNAPTGISSPSKVFKSTDAGATWADTPQSGRANLPGGGIAYHLTHQIPAGLVVSKSVDGGVTYPQHVVAATPADQTGCVCPPGTLIAEGGSLLAGGNVGFVY